MELRHIDELERRIVHHLHRSRFSTEVEHLWGGYLAALVEWGVIDSGTYAALGRLLGQLRVHELYALFADEPMPSGATPRDAREVERVAHPPPRNV